MIRLVCIWLAAVSLAGAAPGAQDQPEAPSNASNSPAATDVPQLSASTQSVAELQSRRIQPETIGTNGPALPITHPAAPIENTTYFILGAMIGVLVIIGVAGRRLKQ